MISVVLFLLPLILIPLGVFLVLGTAAFLIFDAWEDYLRHRGEI